MDEKTLNLFDGVIRKARDRRDTAKALRNLAVQAEFTGRFVITKETKQWSIANSEYGIDDPDIYILESPRWVEIEKILADILNKAARGHESALAAIELPQQQVVQ